jgi:hypothetical protein
LKTKWWIHDVRQLALPATLGVARGHPDLAKGLAP